MKRLFVALFAVALLGCHDHSHNSPLPTIMCDGMMVIVPCLCVDAGRLESCADGAVVGSCAEECPGPNLKSMAGLSCDKADTFDCPCDGSACVVQ